MEIEIKIDIPKRVIDAVKEYCSLNNLDMNEYIADCVVKQNGIDRYGDLNNLIHKSIEKEPEIINHYEVNVSVKEEKKVEEDKPKPKTVENRAITMRQKKQAVEKQNVSVEEPKERQKEEEIIIKPVPTRKRTIKTK